MQALSTVCWIKHIVWFTDIIFGIGDLLSLTNTKAARFLSHTAYLTFLAF